MSCTHTYPRAFYIPKRFPRARRDYEIAVYNVLSPTFNLEILNVTYATCVKIVIARQLSIIFHMNRARFYDLMWCTRVIFKEESSYVEFCTRYTYEGSREKRPL